MVLENWEEDSNWRPRNYEKLLVGIARRLVECEMKVMWTEAGVMA